MGVGVIAALVLASPASAATFTVDSTKDGIDANVADQLCATATGKCTLRAAIDEANDEPGGDEIKLPKGTIELKRPTGPTGATDNAEGDLDVTDAVEIDGRGPDKTVIEQTVKDRVLHASAPIVSLSAFGLRLNDVALTGGRIGGAGVNGGGGIENDNVALLDNVVIRDNVARSDESDNVPGGGIYSNGILGLSDTVVRDNASRGRGETQAFGGGIFVADGGFSMQNGSKIIDNEARLRDSGGEPSALAAAGGLRIGNPGSEPTDSASVFDSTIAGNTALGGDAEAGGIRAGVGTNLEMQRSTVSGNRSKSGGGLYSEGVGTFENSTISGNRAPEGAGIRMPEGSLTLTHVTIARNRVGAAIDTTGDAANDSLDFVASIVAAPLLSCGGDFDVYQGDAQNIFGDGSCSQGISTDMVADPKLKSLSKNPGPVPGPVTRTHALKSGSPAIDFVTTGCPPPGIDQRNLGRPQGPDCDSGSFERRVVP